MNNEHKKPIFCFVGPSGSGKSSVIKILEEKYGLKSLDSFTTRNPRYPGEKGHTFISVTEFKALGDVVAYTFFNGNHYGATKEMVDKADLYAIDINGVKMLREKYDGNIKVIYISINQFVAAKHMKERGDSLKKIISRLKNDRKFFGRKQVKELKPDLVIESSKHTVNEMVEIVRSFMSGVIDTTKTYN